MCLTAEMLAIFLNLLNPQMVTTSAGIITVSAATQETVWVQQGDRWCTPASKQ